MPGRLRHGEEGIAGKAWSGVSRLSSAHQQPGPAHKASRPSPRRWRAFRK